MTEVNDILLSSPRINEKEKQACININQIYKSVSIPDSDKAANFTNWARTRDINRFISRLKLYDLIKNVPGCIFECGVHYGGGVSAWQHITEIYEPVNFTRRIYGFDTFEGFPSVSENDTSSFGTLHKSGDFSIGESADAIIRCLHEIESTRKINITNRLNIVKGDISYTLPDLLASDRSISISLLYLDLDLYEPTKNVLLNCKDRLTKGSVVVFDQYADSNWPGETQALIDTFGINNVSLRCFEQIPRISYFIVD